MTFSILANLASAIAVLVAVILGRSQIRQMRKTRALFTTTELVHAMQREEFARGIRLVLTLPEDADVQLIRDDPDMTAAVLSVSHIYESMGVLVYHRIIHLYLVDDLMGGYVRTTWKRIKPYVYARRSELGVYYGEWMEWLADRLDEHPSPGKHIGAHIAHRGWRPS